tara:strand:+ start:26 stop:514 length:489 start_codon:yes stop_codon:yes gene_type:complete
MNYIYISQNVIDSKKIEFCKTSNINKTSNKLLLNNYKKPEIFLVEGNISYVENFILILIAPFKDRYNGNNIFNIDIKLITIIIKWTINRTKNYGIEAILDNSKTSRCMINNKKKIPNYMWYSLCNEISCYFNDFYFPMEVDDEPYIIDYNLFDKFIENKIDF